LADRWINRTDAATLIPKEVVLDLINGVRKQSVAMRLLRRLPNMSSDQGKFSVLEMLPRAGFVKRNAGLKPVSKVAWAEKELVVGEIAVILAVPDAIIADAEYDIWGEIRPLVIESFGRIFDEQVFNGGLPNVPAEWPRGLIPMTIAAGNVVQEGTGGDILADVARMITMQYKKAYDVTGVAAQRTLQAELLDVRDDNRQFLFASPTAGAGTSLFGVPAEYVDQGVWDVEKATAIAGDWNNAVYSIRSDVSFTLSNTAVLNDEDGRIWLNSFQQDCTAFRAVMRVAWQVADPVDIDRVDADGRRLDNVFPFAVLTPGPVTP